MGGSVKRPYRAYIVSGQLQCPRCGKVLAKAYYGAFAGGIELKCGKCHIPVMLEVSRAKENMYRQQTV